MSDQYQIIVHGGVGVVVDGKGTVANHGDIVSASHIGDAATVAHWVAIGIAVGWPVGKP